MLPLYYGKKLGERLSSKKLKSTTHSLNNARALPFIGKFVKYHHYLKYKDSLRKHLGRCKKHCKSGTLKQLADDERASSSERKEKRKTRRKERKQTRKSKASCKKECKKKKSRKDQRACKRACK